MDERVGYQPQIDGLRAVAIVPVVLFHVGVPGVRSGFVGVDVFFVLSGFLISRLLLTELRQRGKIDFVAFYARRVRRLLPALATVVVTVLALGAVVLSAAGERQDLSRSAMATMGFASNFYFWRAQAGYFAAPTEWVPLLNMWTLSVEEQFYLLWPAMLMAGALVAGRTGFRMVVIVALLLAAGFAVSLAVFGWGIHAKPTATYYLMPTRMWEFALGGALALGWKGPARGSWLAGPAALGGLLLIAVACFLPRMVAVAIVAAALGSAAAIGGVSAAPNSVAGRLLRLRPMVVVGKLSYSWYLWHWPLLALTRAQAAGGASLGRDLAVAAGSLVLAAATYVLIENPIRRRRPWPFAGARSALASGVGVSLAVVALALALQAQADARLRRDPWLAAIAAAARGKVHAPPGCHVPEKFTTLAPAKECLIGPAGAPPRLLLWGDSQAQQLVEAVREDGVRGGYDAVARSMSRCAPFWRGADRGPGFGCAAFNDAVAGELPALLRVGVKGIVLASRSFGFGRRSSTAEDAALQTRLRALLLRAQQANVRVLLVAPIPVFRLPQPQCLAHASARACGSSRSGFENWRKPSLDALRAAVADFPNVRLWDPADLICGRDVCSPVRDGVILYSDSGHLSVQGSRFLAPFLAPQLSWLIRR